MLSEHSLYILRQTHRVDFGTVVYCVYSTGTETVIRFFSKENVWVAMIGADCSAPGNMRNYHRLSGVQGTGCEGYGQQHDNNDGRVFTGGCIVLSYYRIVPISPQSL